MLNVKFRRYENGLARLTTAELEQAGNTLLKHKAPGWRWRIDKIRRLLNHRHAVWPNAWDLLDRDIFPRESPD